jgi:hypothetical protein
VDDDLVWNPYQILEATVKDGRGTVVAQTRATVPTSDEIHCDRCHGAAPFTDILRGTTPRRGRTSSGSNRYSAPPVTAALSLGLHCRGESPICPRRSTPSTPGTPLLPAATATPALRPSATGACATTQRTAVVPTRAATGASPTSAARSPPAASRGSANQSVPPVMAGPRSPRLIPDPPCTETPWGAAAWRARHATAAPAPCSTRGRRSPSAVARFAMADRAGTAPVSSGKSMVQRVAGARPASPVTRWFRPRPPGGPTRTSGGTGEDSKRKGRSAISSFRLI